MVEIIFRNRFYDVAHFYSLQTLGSFGRDLINVNNAGTATRLKAGRSAATKEWEKIQQAYDAQSAG